jgi:hypothetical protein
MAVSGMVARDVIDSRLTTESIGDLNSLRIAFATGAGRANCVSSDGAFSGFGNTLSNPPLDVNEFSRKSKAL